MFLQQDTVQWEIFDSRKNLILIELKLEKNSIVENLTQCMTIITNLVFD